MSKRLKTVQFFISETLIVQKYHHGFQATKNSTDNKPGKTGMGIALFLVRIENLSFVTGV